MKRREFLRTTGAAAVGLSSLPVGWATGAEKKQSEKKQRVLYYTRSAGYEHSAVRRENGQLSHSEKVLIEMGKKAGFEVVCSKDGRVFDGDLDQYDALAFYSCGNQLAVGKRPENPPMTATGKQRLLEAIAAGKGYVGFHSAADTFHSGKEIDPYVAMVGGEFMGHGTPQDVPMLLESPKFPGTGGLDKSFKVGKEEWYAFRNFSKDLRVILAQDTEAMSKKHPRDKLLYSRPAFPATWARMQGKGRVFYTSMGHFHEVWTHPTFQQIVLGGFAWAMRNVDADVTPNVEKVTPGAWQLKAE